MRLFRPVWSKLTSDESAAAIHDLVDGGGVSVVQAC